MNRTKCLFSGVVCALFLTLLPMLAISGQKGTNNKSSRTTKQAVKTQTMILPVRYVRGSRLVRVLRDIFVPLHAHRVTTIRYSPALQKILVRSTPEVLETLKKASRQLDVPQAQFGVRLFLVRRGAGTGNPGNKALSAALKKRFPKAGGFALQHSFYVHALNGHSLTQTLARSTSLYGTALRMTVEQGTGGNVGIQVRLSIGHMRSFSSASRNGTNVQFVTASNLSTRLFVRSGQLVVAGDMPWKDDKGKISRVVVALKVTRLQNGAKAKAEKKGFLSRQSIASVIRKNRTAIRRCYESSLKKNPNLKGRVVVSFTINAEGKVDILRISRTTLKNKACEACILRIFRFTTFPKPRGGGIVRVNYPFLFSPS